MTTGATDPSDLLRQRKLEIAREIAQAFLTATQPVEVYRLALARVTPLVHASFSSVFVRDTADPELLRLACAQNWPQTSARFLSELRIRVGRGPTGRAVAASKAIAVEDVFSDPALREWWIPARELGFVSMITLPLRARGRVNGALSFYFDEPHRYEPEERQLLGLIADQLAATSEKAYLIEHLQEANRQLNQTNEELRAQVEEAEVTRRLKEEFLANVSHELRTPLTAILGYTYLVSTGHAGPVSDAQSEAMHKIDGAATVLLELITDLLDLSDLKLGRARVRESVEEALTLAERAAESAGGAPEGVKLHVSSSSGRIPLLTDGEKVVKILENLISNAFKFTKSGTVMVTVRREKGDMPRGEDVVEWAVEDTGIGIESEDLGPIFDEFRQVDGSSTRLYGGTGLGLALSLRLARLLGGEILVQSEPGHGSKFTLRLPLS